MLENKKLSDREILYQFLRRIPISNRTTAYDIVDRDSNEKQGLPEQYFIGKLSKLFQQSNSN